MVSESLVSPPLLCQVPALSRDVGLNLRGSAPIFLGFIFSFVRVLL